MYAFDAEIWKGNSEFRFEKWNCRMISVVLLFILYIQKCIECGLQALIMNFNYVRVLTYVSIFFYCNRAIPYLSQALCKNNRGISPVFPPHVASLLFFGECKWTINEELDFDCTRHLPNLWFRNKPSSSYHRSVASCRGMHLQIHHCHLYCTHAKREPLSHANAIPFLNNNANMATRHTI